MSRPSTTPTLTVILRLSDPSLNIRPAANRTSTTSTDIRPINMALLTRFHPSTTNRSHARLANMLHPNGKYTSPQYMLGIIPHL
jgi:hypothetical protein